MQPKANHTVPRVTKFTTDDVRRVQSSVAKKNGGEIPKNSYVAAIQGVVAKRSKP